MLVAVLSVTTGMPGAFGKAEVWKKDETYFIVYCNRQLGRDTFSTLVHHLFFKRPKQRFLSVS